MQVVRSDEEREAFYLHTISTQERMLNGCELVFSGLRKSSDPEVVLYADEALTALTHTRAILEAMIDGYNQTKH